jgi:hypothetical protein
VNLLFTGGVMLPVLERHIASRLIWSFGTNSRTFPSADMVKSGTAVHLMSAMRLSTKPELIGRNRFDRTPLVPYQAGMMRFCRPFFYIAFAVFAVQLLAGASHAGPFLQHLPEVEIVSRPLVLAAEGRPEPVTDIFASMSGKCSRLKVAGRDFRCRAVAYSHTEQGRANFAIALDDPSDDTHIITFSGENGWRTQDNLYELSVDRMLLNSKDRPRVDGLPVPFVEISAGVCKQLGNFGARQVSSITCAAVDLNGRRYEMQFESDGRPVTVRRIVRSAPTIRMDPFK